MPQSLLMSTPPLGTSTKRQRSADSRDRYQQPASVGRNATKTGNSSPDGATALRSGVRVPAYLEKSKSEILATFQEVEWKQRFRLFHAMEHPDTSPYKVDRSEVVVNRNRYGNVQPWDASRIKLRTPICGSDYVNASPIVLRSRMQSTTIGTDAASVHEARYIATQGPKQGQESHFWHMVFQETTGDTGVIIMLTQLVEENKEKCAQYYPLDLDNATMALLHEEKQENGNAASSNDASNIDDSTTMVLPSSSDFGSLDSITLLSKESDDRVGCEVRKLCLRIHGNQKTIIHYLFDRWPDFGKPEAADRKALIELSRRSFVEAGDSPRVVHCSAGVGRTGTWIALDYLIREVEEGRLLNSPKRSNAHSTKQAAAVANGSPSRNVTWGNSGPSKIHTPTLEEGFEKDEHDLIYETVNALREQRMMMVIREVQFAFLYEAVKEAVLEKYQAKPEGVVVHGAADLDVLPPHSKTRRVSGDAAVDENVSDAETEIMEPETRQARANDDDDDPYSAVSPDFVRHMSHET